MIKNSHSNGFAHAVLIIGLVVALIGALGFVFWQNFIHKEPVRTELLKTEVSSKEAPVDSSSDWKTYTSERDGYSIDYPKDWTVIAETEGDGLYIRNFDPASKSEGPKEGNTNYPKGYMNLSVYVNEDDSNYRAQTGMSPSQFYDKLGKSEVGGAAVTYSPNDVKTITVGKYQAKSAKSEFTETNEVVFILNNGKLYSINLFPYGTSSNVTIQKILNSFSIK